MLEIPHPSLAAITPRLHPLLFLRVSDPWINMITTMNSSQQENSLPQAVWDSSITFRSSIVSFLVATLVLFLYTSFATEEGSAEAPFVGYRGFWEPTLLLRLRFCTRALPILTKGYKNVVLFSATPISLFLSKKGLTILDSSRTACLRFAGSTLTFLLFLTSTWMSYETCRI